jgi:hypothetical protein
MTNKIQVKVYSVDTVDCSVKEDITEYDSWEDLLIELEDEFEEDVDGESIRDLDQGTSIVIKGDVWFNQYQLLEK